MDKAIYYYPTTIMFVDDKKSYLSQVSKNVSGNFPYLCFSDPNEALNYLIKNINHNNVIASQLSENLEPSAKPITAGHDFTLDLSQLYLNVYNHQRYNEISIVVVDYNMPGINGIEFCEQLRAKGAKYKVIMLTGQADTALAIKLFNAGIIDKFILKNDPEVDRELEKAIVQMQQEYFYEKSSATMEVLKTQNDFCLNNKAFKKFFLQKCIDLKISEYYLISPNGSFILFQFDGKPLWLIVASENQMKEYIELAKTEGASKLIIEYLERGIKIPYFHTQDELLNVAGLQWEPYLYSATKMNGDYTFYYALVPDQRVFPLKENIVSHRQFLES